MYILNRRSAMNRKGILEAYDVSERGTITNPGQFEGEMLYVPYFWESFLDGFADRDDGRVLGFDVSAEDKIEFPELKSRRTVKLYQRDDGFVCEVR
jgi:hypothetical protein